jgi:hypothetical protein
VGVAGAASAAGVALAHGDKVPKILAPVLHPQAGVSAPPSLDGFFEETGPGPCVPTYGGGPDNAQGPRNRYITFYASNLPAGTYNFDMTQQVDANPAGAIQASGAGTAVLPWEYNGSKPVHVVVRDPGSEPTCPEDNLDGSNSHQYDSLPVSGFTLSATHDVVFYVHILYSNNVAHVPSGQTTTFTGTLSGTVSLPPQPKTVTSV